MRVLLGVCGGIAAYKAAELVRLLRKRGDEVRVIMTESATQFITPLTFQALSGHSVRTELLTAEAENGMDHISLARWAEVLLIAPATANSLAKYAHGLADDLLSTVYLAAQCPVYIAPAMNQAMWHKPVTQRNITTLKNDGVIIIEPEQGEQACGEQGFGRMAEPVSICERVQTPTIAGCLQGLRVLISAGSTREPIDPVRYITNRSSGKMGYALARAAIQSGAKVTLVSGVVNLTVPQFVTLIQVETAAQMYEAVMKAALDCDIYIGAAAVADYRPQLIAAQKIKKHTDQTNILLEKTQDILADVAKLTPLPFTLGFAAETDDLEKYAKNKLLEKNLDMIAANWVGREQGGFDSEQNALQVFWSTGEQTLAMADKSQIATQLIKLCAERFHAKNTI